MLYALVLGVHVCAMMLALLSFVAAEILLALARRGRREPAKMALIASGFGNTVVGPGVLAGVVLVFVGGWSIGNPWLLMSLGLIAALMMVRRVFVDPWEARVQSALQGEVPIAEITMFAQERAAFLGRATVIALFAVVAALMVAKPVFSGLSA